MAAAEATASAVRSKAENLFSLEEGFFASAVVYWEGFSKDAVGSEAEGSTTEHKRELGAVYGDADDETSEEVGHEEALAKEGTTSLRRWVCNSCGFKFQTGDEQRSHFKSDYHRLNIKRKMAGKKPLSEEQFEAFAEGRGDEDSNLSSISGSDTASDDSDVEDHGFNKDNFQERFKHPVEKNASKYVSFLLQSGEIVSLWRCILAHNKELLQRENGNISLDSNMEKLCVTERELLRRLNLLSGSFVRTKCLWIVLLNAGGHFAGVVKDMRNGSVLAHQTFHRYVVRAKAGGRQSSKDATGRAPKSAGASLRRYNELALEKDIKELLKSWQQYFELADCIFVHAPSRNRQALFGGKIPLLTHSDNRIRQVPFTTRRPTFKEAKRVLHNLTTLLYRVDERNSSSASLSLKELSRGQAKESKEQITPAVLECSKGLKNKQALVYQDTNNESSALQHDARSQPSGVDSEECMENMMSTEDCLPMSTALHEAAKSGNADLVSELLDNGADPCVRDSRGRTPYALASTKESRNAFRKFMAYHPEKWDWHAANVPSPLTEELEAAQAIKQAEKIAKRKAKEKERKKQRKAQEKALQDKADVQEVATSSTSTAQGGLAFTKKKGLASDRSRSEDPAEVLKRLQIQERELRAAAAERRLKEMVNSSKQPSSNTENLSTAKVAGVPSTSMKDSGNQDGNICSCCGTSLAEIIPFYRYSYKYCSTTCVHVHRNFLESEE